MNPDLKKYNTYRVELILGKKKVVYWQDFEAQKISDIRKAVKIKITKVIKIIWIKKQ